MREGKRDGGKSEERVGGSKDESSIGAVNVCKGFVFIQKKGRNTKKNNYSKKTKYLIYFGRYLMKFAENQDLYRNKDDFWISL